MLAAQNVKDALQRQGKRRDWRDHYRPPPVKPGETPPKVEALVELATEDVRALCAAAGDDDVARVIGAGAAAAPRPTVVIRVDDAYRLLDLAGNADDGEKAGG